VRVDAGWPQHLAFRGRERRPFRGLVWTRREEGCRFERWVPGGAGLS
jgi:hypothetical protein